MDAKETKLFVVMGWIHCNEQHKQNESTFEKKQTGQMETIQSFIRNLASLSLEDYKWRSALFKTNEADRLMEESLARMRGENPSYLRPMDAAEDKIGPLVSPFNLGFLTIFVHNELIFIENVFFL